MFVYEGMDQKHMNGKCQQVVEDGRWWSPDGGWLNAKDNVLYWDDGNVTCLNEGGVVRLLSRLEQDKRKGKATMEKIKITSKDMSGRTVKITKADGTELLQVSACDIKLRPGGINTATLWLNLDRIDIEAEPLLSLDTIRDAAYLHGYYLVPIDHEKEGV